MSATTSCARSGTRLHALTEPLLMRIRRFLPNTGGVDISPVILFLFILLIEQVIALYIYPYVF